MATKDFKRKLSAILSADVAGYSRLMGEDEAATVEAITTYREIMGGLIRQHRGRVVDSPGDNILAEFGSVVDAVQCAVAVQKEFQARNTELPENRRMEFRIGINLGDVIEEEDRIYGDGVNIAARLEALADPGGICVSKTAFDHIETKLPLGYEYLGDQTVKNIPKPVGAYRVLMEPRVTVAEEIEKKKAVPVWRHKAILAGGVALVLVVIAALIWNFYFRPPPIEPASVEKMAFPLPEKPSIAVLPFDNLSADPAQEYIADGMTENIISALSKISEMFVIARNSAFVYKGKPVKVQQVAEELGVRHILEGSVQKSGNQVRVTAQLIDALTGHHLWSEQYDRDIEDLFALQDEITKEIVVALQVKLTHGEQARVWHKTTDNIQAWGYAVKATSLFEHYTKGDNAKARQLLEQALQLDPNYAYAWMMLAWTHFIDARLGFSKSPSESIKRATELAKKASALDDTLPDVHSFWNTIYLIQRQYDKAIAEGEKAIALGPNNALAHILQAQTMIYSGRFEEAVALAEKSIRLSPYYPAWYLLFLGGAYRMVGRYDEALSAFIKLLERSKKGEFSPMLAHLNLANVYVDLGRIEEARVHGAEVLRINPKFSLELIDKITFYKDPAHLKKRKESLRKAGLPDKPPLPVRDKRSIAVLPFTNMSDDPEQEYFSDGITEEIITALFKIPEVFVIARNSSFTYKGKPVKVQQVARELGVKYVLEGSVRKAGDRVRIRAQLVDTTTGHHLWAERYDRELKDIFALQDEITMKILTELQVKLTEAEQARLLAKGTDNLGAYLKALQAIEYGKRGNREGNLLARQMAEEAMALDPEYARPYRVLAITHVSDIIYGTSKSPKKSLEQALELTQKAISLDESDPCGYEVLARIYLMMRQHDRAIAEAEGAIALDPNGADAHAALGLVLTLASRQQEAIAPLEKAIRINPIAPPSYFRYLGAAYRDTGRYEEAISACKKVLHREPKNVIARLVLTGTYSLSGREEEARGEAAEILRIEPKFCLERLAKTRPHKNQANTERFIDSLRKAGLK